MSEAMTGGGDYDRHSEPQQRDAADRDQLVASAAGRIVPDPARGAVTIVDYGCGQGRVTDALVRTAVHTVRETHRDVPITVVHNDLLANDWATLLARLREPDSYLHTAGGPVTPMISAVSFYEPVVPHGLVDLGTSFAAIQWLSRPGPAGTGSAIYFDQLTGEARTGMAAQAHADWTGFLERRADELAPGGRLVVDMMGLGPDGVATGHDAWSEVRGVAEELVATGRLDADRLDGYVVPIYERTVDEIRRPFAEDVGERLVLEHLDVADSPVPASNPNREPHDVAALGRQFVAFFRAFSEPTLRAALDPAGDSIDELYRRLEARIAARADEFSFVVHAVTLVIARANG